MSLHRALQRLLLRRGEAAWCAGVGRSCCRRWASARQAPADQDDDGAASTSGRCEEQQHQQQQAPPHLATRLLLRDFIHNSLYHPVRGYFNRPQPPVGHLDTPFNYWKLYCAAEWRQRVADKYVELQTSFLTPAELFSPWYGYILARHIMEHRKHTLGLDGLPLHIIEVGGGNGTLARDVLDWLRDNRPDDYARTSYMCLEISATLAAQQYEAVVVKGGHGGKFRLSRGNAWEAASWGSGPVWDHTYVIMMEVLDNLPHDRVYRRSSKHPWQQTAVVALDAGQGGHAGAVPLARPPTSRHLSHQGHSSGAQGAGSGSGSSRSSSGGGDGGACMETGPWREELEPLTDPLIQRALDAAYTPVTLEQRLDKKLNRLLDFLLAREGDPDVPEGELLFVPTAALALLDLLHRVRPNHSLIATDFDHLPDVRIPGKNAPLVAEKVGGRNIDHTTILVPWGCSDIFFPTDFDALGRMYRASAEAAWGSTGTVSTSHYVQGAVMKRYREMERTATICSFNPMIDDFRNARFFFGDSWGRSSGGSGSSSGGAGVAPGAAPPPRTAPGSATPSGRAHAPPGPRHHAIVDWDGASGDTRSPSSARPGQARTMPTGLPEWARKRLLAQQEQQQQQQQQQQQGGQSQGPREQQQGQPPPQGTSPGGQASAQAPSRDPTGTGAGQGPADEGRGSKS